MRRPAAWRALMALPLVALLPLGPATAAPHAPAAPADTAPGAVLATDLLTPLTLTAGADGDLWFTQNFRGALEVLHPGQPAQKVYQSRGGLEVGAVSYDDGRTYFTVSGRDESYGRLFSIVPGGKAKQIADLGAYEKAHNPDARERFGLKGLAASCAAKFTGRKQPTYTGKTQTHPYATLRTGGATIVADAAANAVLKVKDNGRVKPIAVLPSVRTTVTKTFARQNKLPGCTVGKAYRAEPVPTDVVSGPDGSLYVSTLPGGPASEGAEAAGAVWRLDPKKGRLTKVAGGLTTPTGISVAPNGDVYVAELFGNRISRIAAGSHTAVPFAQVPLPGDVLALPGGLVATTNVLSGTSGKKGDPPNATIARYAY